MSEERQDFTAACERSVRADPETAWRAWVDPDMLTAWMGARESGGDGTPRLIAVRNVRVAPEAGAPFHLDMVTREADGSERVWEHDGEVLEAEPARRLRLTWISEGTGQETTELDLSFTPTEGGGARVALRHHGFATEEMARDHTEGWDLFMELFQEAMMSAALAGAKLTATWLKQQLAARRVPSADVSGVEASGVGESEAEETGRDDSAAQ